MIGLAELLADCDAHGIRRLPAGDGGLAVDAPQDALTPDLIGRLKSHKGELLEILPAGGAPVPLAQIVNTSVPADGKWHTIYDITHGEYDRINQAFATHPNSAEPRCRCHKEQRWWRSIHGDHRICGICHPPATPDVVKEWYENEEVIVAN